MTFSLNKGVDIQDLGKLNLKSMPQPQVHDNQAIWDDMASDNIVGYSIFSNDQRLNDKLITSGRYSTSGDIAVRPVIKGGYETVYSSQDSDYKPCGNTPISYAFNIYPNPFASRTYICYALPNQAFINIKIYDVSGKLVKTLVSEKNDPGFYRIDWSGDDNINRKVAQGVYFVHMETEDFASYDKIIFVD
jgi:hypothetical protein